MSNELKDKIETAIEALRPLAEQANLPEPHWIHGGDEGLDYCEKCANEEAEKLKESKPGDYEVVSGGIGESDSPRSCHDCHAPLNYTLTEYGAAAELAHFLENGVVGRKRTISPLTAYELVEMFSALKHEDAALRAAADLATKTITLVRNDASKAMSKTEGKAMTDTISARWAVSKSELDRLESLSSKDELLGIWTPTNGEGVVTGDAHAVVVLRDGTVTNRYADGTVGVTDEVREMIEAIDSLYHPVEPGFFDECDDTEQWIDVLVDENGAFAGLKSAAPKPR